MVLQPVHRTTGLNLFTTLGVTGPPLTCSIQVPGFLICRLHNTRYKAIVCNSAGLVISDFDGDNWIQINDIVILIRSYNGVADSSQLIINQLYPRSVNGQLRRPTDLHSAVDQRAETGGNFRSGWHMAFRFDLFELDRTATDCHNYENAIQ